MRWACPLFCISLCAPLPALGAGHDYPGLGHIQGYHLNNYSERGFDRISFDGDAGQKIPVQGHTFYIEYNADDGANHGSDLEIYLNFEEIVKQLKGEILHLPANMDDDNEHFLARIYRNGAPIYIDADARGNGSYYEISIVEQKEFHPSIVTSPSQ